jgi:hypothetical protein
MEGDLDLTGIFHGDTLSWRPRIEEVPTEKKTKFAMFIREKTMLISIF